MRKVIMKLRNNMQSKKIKNRIKMEVDGGQNKMREKTRRRGSKKREKEIGIKRKQRVVDEDGRNKKGNEIKRKKKEMR